MKMLLNSILMTLAFFSMTSFAEGFDISEAKTEAYQQCYAACMPTKTASGTLTHADYASNRRSCVSQCSDQAAVRFSHADTKVAAVNER